MASVMEADSADEMAPDPPRAAPAGAIPVVPGLPWIGNTLEMAKDPAAFFLRA